MDGCVDVVIIGAGASGLMCAAQAGQRNRKVLILDHGANPGRKILISGGGRCNFTNKQVSAENYISSNPHFCKSAISRYTSSDFVELVDRYGIHREERSHGQLFCKKNAAQIVKMLLAECRLAGVKTMLNTKGIRIDKIPPDSYPDSPYRFRISFAGQKIETTSLVIATGGVSYPQVGATAFAYQIAKQFDIPVVTPQPGLVPFTLQSRDKKLLKPLSGISVDATVSTSHTAFTEKLLFTHRGLSGPVILQVSSYWQPGKMISIDLLPFSNFVDIVKRERLIRPKKQLKSILYEWLPKRLVDVRLDDQIANIPICSVGFDQVEQAAQCFHDWQIKPGGTEGNRTAEVTVGGVDCKHISSKTMESQNNPGLFFIGEALDVTGWLGGYNLQWAWSSGFCAGQYV